MSNAELARFIDRYTIEYTRFYPHPIERVWRAITDPEAMSAWFAPIAFEARVGGAYAALWDGPTTGFKGIVTAFEPPRLIRFGGPDIHGPEGYWQFELEPAAGGTRMVFVQHSQPGAWINPGWPLDPPESAPDTPWRPGTLAGWHEAFDSLGDRLDDAPASGPGFAALEAAYREHMRATLP